MRVWDCDPILLNSKHLRAQHAEIHFAIRVIVNDWRTKWKDVERFREDEFGIQWLAFVHDITVHELRCRGKFANHATPAPPLQPFFRGLLDLYKRGFLSLSLPEGGYNYMDRLIEQGYPPTRLNQGTPWERDNVSFEWYMDHHNDWTREMAEDHGKAS